MHHPSITHITSTFYIFSHFPSLVPYPPPFWCFLTSSFITWLVSFCLPVCQHQSSTVEIRPINVSCTSAQAGLSSNRALLMCSGASTALRYRRWKWFLPCICSFLTHNTCSMGHCSYSELQMIPNKSLKRTFLLVHTKLANQGRRGREDTAVNVVFGSF